jgi:formylglycine-generating enzyme required for sulfatase activity
VIARNPCLILAAFFVVQLQAQTISPNATTNAVGSHKGNSAPVEGAPTDPLTALPTRVLHKPSGLVLVLIPAGAFQMGSPPEEAERLADERQHQRLVKKPFYLGETEVTVAQFRRFVRATGYLTDAERSGEAGDRGKGAFASTPDGDREWSARASWQNPFPTLPEYQLSEQHPVVQVSWNDSTRFVEHYGLQLPSEAQWEYAIRAGSRTRFFWGDTESGAEGYGNVKDASGRKRFPRWNSSFPFNDKVILLADTRKFRPNPWQLYDMVGNVSEWCQDAYAKNYPTAAEIDERALTGDGQVPRVIRGSSWLDAPDFSRSAKRIAFRPQGRRDFVGFRVAATIASLQ